MRRSHRIGLLCLAGAWACSTARPEQASAQRGTTACAPRAWEQFGGRAIRPDRQPAYIAAVTPAPVRAVLDTIVYADTVDLNCDGRTDYVAQGRARTNGSLAFVAFVNDSTGWRRVLMSTSPVQGTEVLALAADLTGGGRRDLITVGSDEGGYLPRAFRWRGDRYQPVAIPRVYVLRHEEDWDAACRQKINPQWVAPGAVRLLRETISPTSTMGHGAECDLPADTLRIVGDSLVRVRH
jgi:hypothetical protein